MRGPCSGYSYNKEYWGFEDPVWLRFHAVGLRVRGSETLGPWMLTLSDVVLIFAFAIFACRFSQVVC